MRRISYSAIRRFENCPASYLYYLLIPRIDFATGKDVSLFGRKFHEWAEVNFQPSEFDMIIQDDPVDKKALEEMAISIRHRDYFDYPAINELEISHKIEPIAEVWGFPDRICVDVEERKIIIVDYKTVFDPDPMNDIKQLQLYAYIVYSNTELRRKIIDILSEEYPALSDSFEEVLTNPSADQFYLILDYVKADYIYPFIFDDLKIKRFERYLFGVLRRISDTETDFGKHKNMRKITHCDGNCGYCKMTGICVPYHIIYNSYYDTEFEREVQEGWDAISALPASEGVITEQYLGFEPGTTISFIQESFCSEKGILLEDMINGQITLSSMGLITEFNDRQRIATLNKNRADALKRSLLMRHENGDPVVNAYFRKQKNTVTSYPTDEVLKLVMPKIVKSALKDVRFKDMIDFNKIEAELRKVVASMVNSGIKRSNIPEAYHDDMEKFKTVSYTNPYLKSIK